MMKKKKKKACEKRSIRKRIKQELNIIPNIFESYGHPVCFKNYIHETITYSNFFYFDMKQI